MLPAIPFHCGRPLSDAIGGLRNSNHEKGFLHRCNYKENAAIRLQRSVNPHTAAQLPPRRQVLDRRPDASGATGMAGLARRSGKRLPDWKIPGPAAPPVG